MHLRAGTSGYAYREWRGKFYPSGLTPPAMLPFYAQHFSVVEINATFYRLPSAAVLASWCEQVPDGFLFACKAPGLITHRKRLRAADAETAAFTVRVAALGEHLGPLLFQLPPYLPCDLPLLDHFLASLTTTRTALEFRHPSWFNAEVYRLLREHGCALCLSDRDDAPPPPLVTTACFGYVRLRRAKYTQAELREWKRKFVELGWREAFVFFRHETTARGPLFAARMQEE